eukprot:5990831-Prymnesium_polylepis.1
MMRRLEVPSMKGRGAQRASDTPARRRMSTAISSRSCAVPRSVQTYWSAAWGASAAQPRT